MRRVNQRRRDRGAVALIVTVLFAGGVLMGCAALTVDVGQLYSERRQLQNGADAAALSLAKICATGGTCSYTGANVGTLGANRISNLNNVNAKDDYAGFNATFNGSYDNGLCGRATALPECVAPNGSLLDCPTRPSWLMANTAIPYVEVHNLTQTTSGGSILPSTFGRAVTGFSGAAVSSCARVAWGTPGGGGGNIPITVSGCDWQRATGGTTGGGGGAYYPPPVYNGTTSPDYGYGPGHPSPFPTPAASPPAMNQGQEVILMLQNPTSNGSHTTPSACPNWQGHALPGGFSVLETTSDPCVTREYPHQWMHTSTGNNTTCNLDNLVGKVIYIPVFDCTFNSLPATDYPADLSQCSTGNGNNAYYHRAGYAAFYLSGYAVNVTGSVVNKRKSVVSDAFPCNGSDRCISGWFLGDRLQASYIQAPAPSSGSGYFGAFVILPAG